MRTSVLRLFICLCALQPALMRVEAGELLVGPETLRGLVRQQLFNDHGRWILHDDGGVCYAFLQDPATRLSAGRLLLDARLVSRLGQRVGDTCIGADFASKMTVSGKLAAAGGKLVLDDVRVDRVEDPATRDALDLVLKLNPESLPRRVTLELAESSKNQTVQVAGIAARVERLSIVNVTTQANSVQLTFDLNLRAP